MKKIFGYVIIGLALMGIFTLVINIFKEQLSGVIEAIMYIPMELRVGLFFILFALIYGLIASFIDL